MAGSSNITNDESIIFADNASFDGTERGGKLTADGQLWIGSTASPHVRKGTITAGAGVSITNGNGSITVGLTGGGAAVDSLTPNSGTSPVVPDVNGNIDLQGTGSITTVGGTNSLTPQLTGLTNHTVLVGAGTATITKVGPGSAGQVLQSGGASADPAYSTATYPTTSGTSGNVITSNGTNFVSSAPAASMLVTTITSGSGNWTADSRTKYVRVMMWGGGGGAGSGRRGTTENSGGGGGGGGGSTWLFEGPATAFSGSIAYSVGAGGVGGIPQTLDSTDGNPGSVGGNTVFGSAIAVGGNFGLGGVVGNASGGSTRTSISNLFVSSASSLGAGANGTLTAGNNAIDAVTLTLPFSIATGGGGGAGGNLATPTQAGNGGGLLDSLSANLVAPAAGGIFSGTQNGANGGTAYATGGMIGGGMGGGGGGGATTGSTQGGRGGDGSAPGGGGGGGGGGLNGLDANGGRGGTGGSGRIIIYEFF